MPVRRLVATAILLLVSRSAAAGQTIPSPYRYYETHQEVSVFGGWISPGTGQFGFGPRPGPIVGIRYGVDLSGVLSAEAVVSGISTTRDVMDPRRREGDRKIGTADSQLGVADGRLKLSLTGPRTWHRLNPIVYLGAGAAWDFAPLSAVEEGLAETDRFKFKTSFVGVLGAGMRWFMTDQWIVRAEGGLHLWRLKTPDGFRLVDRGFGDVGSSEWANAGAVSIGFGRRF